MVFEESVPLEKNKEKKGKIIINFIHIPCLITIYKNILNKTKNNMQNHILNKKYTKI